MIFMKFNMFRSIFKIHKIFNSIIKRIFINMVDNFIRLKISPNIFFHYQTMFIDILSTGIRMIRLVYEEILKFFTILYSFSTPPAPMFFSRNSVVSSLFLLLIFNISFAQDVQYSIPQVEEADASPSGYYWKYIYPNSSLTDNGDTTATIDFVAPLAGIYLKLDASNDPVTGNLLVGTSGAGAGMRINSTDVASYWDWLANGNLNVYGAGDFTYDGFSGLSLTGATLTTDSTITMSAMTSGSVLFAGTGGLISQDTDFTFVSDVLGVPTIKGGSASGGTLTLQSTSHATKGKILFGTSAYDEVNNRLGIGTASPLYKFQVNTTTSNYGIIHTDGTIKLGTYVGASGGAFGTISSHDLGFYTADSVNQMTLQKTTGNLGLGNENPSVKLHVEGDQIIDNTSTEALLIRKDIDGGDVFTVNTTNKRINLYGGGGAGLPTFDFWANWMRVGAIYNGSTRTDDIYKNFSLLMAGENSTTKPDWTILSVTSNPTNIGNFLSIGGGGKGATQIDFYVGADQTVNATYAASLRYNKCFGVGNLAAFYPSGSFAAIDGAGIYIFDDATKGAEMITAAADRQFDAGHNWVVTSNWSVQSSGGNPGGYLRYSAYSGGGTATLAAANLTGQLKANRWYALQIDLYIEDWTAFGPYITTATSAEWQQFTYDSPAWLTMTKFFRPTADGVGLVFGWKSSSLADITRIDNVSLKELQAGDLDVGGQFHGTGATIRGTNGYDVDPESDIDTDIISVNVTGSPKLWWDESEDKFALTHGIIFADATNLAFNTTTGTKIGTATTQKLGFFNQTPTTQPTALTTQLTTLTYTAPTPDYAIQNLSLTGYGFVTADEGNTVLSVIKNLQDRVGELETKLKALGLIA